MKVGYQLLHCQCRPCADLRKIHHGLEKKTARVVPTLGEEAEHSSKLLALEEAGRAFRHHSNSSAAQHLRIGGRAVGPIMSRLGKVKERATINIGISTGIGGVGSAICRMRMPIAIRPMHMLAQAGKLLLDQHHRHHHQPLSAMRSKMPLILAVKRVVHVEAVVAVAMVRLLHPVRKTRAVLIGRERTTDSPWSGQRVSGGH
mmetsp:Transcript_33936/g.54010  ORF Transcript_33936/g.54010 Transcript_33936/m.54010 type:complete len:202 (-) Transcript_33936:180-785(-)